MLNHTIWNNRWSKWLLTLPMLVPIVFALSIMVEAPANASEGSSSEFGSELPESQNYKLDSDQVKGVGYDFLRNFVQITKPEENAIDCTTRTYLDNSNTTSIETEAFISPSLSVAELGTSDIIADVLMIEHPVNDQQTDELLQLLEESQSVVDRTDLNPHTQEIG